MDIILVLQTSISPVILISGVGLLLLTMTNRLGRTIDRARALAKEVQAPDSDKNLQAQLDILWRRSRHIRTSIILASASALSASFLIAVLFVGALIHVKAHWLIVGLFLLCLLFLVGSLTFFIREVNESLAALKLELRSNARN